MAELVAEGQRAEQSRTERRRRQGQFPRPGGQQTRLRSMPDTGEHDGGHRGHYEHHGPGEKAGADPGGTADLVAERAERTGGGADGDGRRQRGQCVEGASHAGFDGVRRRAWGGGGRLLLGRGGGIAHGVGRGHV